MIIDTKEKIDLLLTFINSQEILSYDTETTGLNTRKDTVIGFGVSTADRGYYVPIYEYSTETRKLQRCGVLPEEVQTILLALRTKKLLMFNASFDARITKYNLAVDLVPALHCDVLLLKHTCDEDFPFGLKEISKKLWGHDVTKEKEEMQASIKTNGGTATEYYKASTELLARYCVADCLLTFKLFNHYGAELRRQGLDRFYYNDEVLPLYREVTIPMEEQGIKLDMSLLQNSLQEIKVDMTKVEDSIQSAVLPFLSSVFVPWFLNKDYPLTTFKSGKSSAWTKKYPSQEHAWRAENPTGHMFNLQSKHHLKKLFFDTLKEEPLSRTEKGSPQVDEAFLELMSKKYDWAAQLIVFNKLTKIKGTYIERLLEEQEDGYFYPSFQQHRTVSGRYSGDLQQLPRPVSGDGLVAKYTNRIRAFLISDHDSVLMSADYEQLEPRVFCHVSGDTALAAIFNEGKDFYSEIARLVEGCSEVSKEQRQKAKSYALGIPYGMTGYKLKFEIDCEQDEADWLVQKYLKSFPALNNWMGYSKALAMDSGSVISQLGRKRRLPRLKQIFAKYGAKIHDDLELWKALHDFPGVYTLAKKERREFKNYLNNAINFQIQSMAASIMNRASIQLARAIRAQGLKTRLLMQVHDELVLQVPESEHATVSELVKSTMQNIVKLSVPLLTTPQSATNYKDCK